tara:strand:+ start:211 stop:480 length:270 start_codon:yes stop_codon:yes gene_type:complete
MKKTIILTTLISSFLVLTAFRASTNIESTKIESIVVSDFCDGWEEGYQEALEGCLKVGVTPICPIAPIGKDSYKHGYGMGYAKAQKKCE